MKARTKAAKRRGGRPLKPNAKRTPDGRLSRSNDVKESETKLMLEAATWKRRRENPRLSVEDARKQEHGSVIHAWKLAHDAFKAKHDDKKINPMSFTAQNLETAQQVQQAYESYRAAIAARSPRSASDFSGPGGYDGADPFDTDRQKRDARAIERWVGPDGKGGMRNTIVKSGPFGMMAVEAIVFENKPMDSLIGDLRLALNAVDRRGQISKAA